MGTARPTSHRLLDSLGLIDEIANFLGQPFVTLARLMRGDLQGDGTEEIVIPLGMAPEQCFELFRSSHRPPRPLFPVVFSIHFTQSS